ncbi:NUDIX domain-containing protein [Micromonospora sp. WMMD1082]|uniref:NUDIX domain-containing protein n=1 Tax=Micromonospora sp. WMMD1082 TaxID=3016104 RepID=UPI0024166BEC|nr:NUDIX domain-containing protein [Micromonospora sp. WMMD1082]MDG4795122.1 NUDIX domain-containing protein [Micromonospora sp. WMMD1082]
MSPGRPDATAGLPRKRVAAGLLITDPDQRVLLVAPAYQVGWEIPGGCVEADQSPCKAAIREGREELGLELGGTRSCSPCKHQFDRRTEHAMTTSNPTKLACASHPVPLRRTPRRRESGAGGGIVGLPYRSAPCGFLSSGGFEGAPERSRRNVAAGSDRPATRHPRGR